MAIDRLDFDVKISEMESNFGRDLKSKEREFLYDKVKFWSQKEFFFAVKEVIDNEDRFPKVRTLKIYRSKFQMSLGEESTSSCAKCSQGWCYVGEQVYRASCEHGQKLWDKVPIRSDGLARPFFDLSTHFRALRLCIEGKTFGLHLPLQVKSRLLDRIKPFEEEFEVPF